MFYSITYSYLSFCSSNKCISSISIRVYMPLPCVLIFLFNFSLISSFSSVIDWSSPSRCESLSISCLFCWCKSRLSCSISFKIYSNSSILSIIYIKEFLFFFVIIYFCFNKELSPLISHNLSYRSFIFYWSSYLSYVTIYTSSKSSCLSFCSLFIFSIYSRSYSKDWVYNSLSWVESLFN